MLQQKKTKLKILTPASSVNLAGQIFGRKNFFVIAGPCVIENNKLIIYIAQYIANISARLDLPILFKASFDKANRTSLASFRGPGFKKGLEILLKVKEKTGLPVTSDIHIPDQAVTAAEVLDVIQIPAFLCRQTDLLVEAGRTGRPINIKKGPFLAPSDIEQAVLKILKTGNKNIWLTERGSSFGYRNLVVDMRAIPIMQTIGCPVIFDATHSVQLPGFFSNSSGGEQKFIFPLSRAAIAAGANGIFLEIHPEPKYALCDGPNSLPLEKFEAILVILKQLYKIVNEET